MTTPHGVPSGVLGRPTIRAFNELWYRKAPRRRRDELQSIDKFFYPLDMVREWNRLYGPRGFVQWQCQLPFGAEGALRACVEALSGEGATSFLAVLKTLGAADPGPLSFPDRGWTLALDVPAGSTEVAALLRRYPDLRATVFDEPAVVAHAAEVLSEAGVADRAKLVGGDFFTSVPAGADTYLMSMIMHDWADEPADTILTNVRRAMGPDAELLIIDAILPEGIELHDGEILMARGQGGNGGWREGMLAAQDEGEPARGEHGLDEALQLGQRSLNRPGDGGLAQRGDSVVEVGLAAQLLVVELKLAAGRQDGRGARCGAGAVAHRRLEAERDRHRARGGRIVGIRANGIEEALGSRQVL